ncbi:MAG: hypothetical protein H7312_20435 [Tardiphaga sp.]|nr:hypothetical protein [Tardiphaga sp.]
MPKRKKQAAVMHAWSCVGGGKQGVHLPELARDNGLVEPLSGGPLRQNRRANRLGPRLPDPANAGGRKTF